MIDLEVLVIARGGVVSNLVGMMVEWCVVRSGGGLIQEGVSTGLDSERRHSRFFKTN